MKDEERKEHLRQMTLEKELDEMFLRVDQIPILDQPTSEEILEYDEIGLPK